MVTEYMLSDTAILKIEKTTNIWNIKFLQFKSSQKLGKTISSILLYLLYNINTRVNEGSQVFYLLKI